VEQKMAIQPPVVSQWRPPANFQPVPSAVEGITVYGPRPKTAEADVSVVYKCPKCGATTQYDVAASGVACEHCGYVAPISVDQVGRQADAYEFTLDTLKQAQQGWGTAHQVLHCDSCGAEILVPPGGMSVTCPFCASNEVAVRAAAANHLKPNTLIPFKVTPDLTRLRAKEWLGKGWFQPKELATNAILDGFSGIYLSFWTFAAQINSKWKAEVGHERSERYYDSSSKEWRTRIVIDWRWENGRVGINVADLLIPGNDHVSHVILEKIYPFNLNELVAYQPDFLAGWQAQVYDVSLPDAWEQGKVVMRERSKNACQADIHSIHVRNFSMTADFADEAWRYSLLPVYLAAYKFENKVYQVMVNGQTGAVAGQKPVAWWKIWLAIAGLLTPGILIGLIGLLLLVVGIGVVPIGIALALLVIGGIISFKLYQQAVASEAA
jgi:DNA-directed RNA polymerase subunit RPC12/RpoP